MSQANTSDTVRNVVLVHGGFVDGSGWEGVYHALKQDGYTVAIVQNPTTSLADDVAATKRVIAAQVARLVYIAAFAPDAGESVATLLQGFPKDAPQPPILPPQEGFLLLDRAQFPAAFAGDLGAEQAAFMADAQVPWGLDALDGTISTPAWKAKPSWYLLTTADRMIPPEAQRSMARRLGATVSEAEGSHAIYVSQPQAVAALIEAASRGA